MYAYRRRQARRSIGKLGSPPHGLDGRDFRLALRELDKVDQAMEQTLRKD
jgi:hypothetical protein